MTDLTTRIAVAIHGATPPNPDAALALHQAQAERVLPVVEAEVARLRAALTEIADTHERNRWHPQTNHPSELSHRWHDGYISCAATHSLIATAALDPEQAAENDRIWAIGAQGSDSDWFRETGHCGNCGTVASSCECDGACGCWEDHGPPLKPWGGVLADREAKGEARIRDAVSRVLLSSPEPGELTATVSVAALRKALATAEEPPA